MPLGLSNCVTQHSGRVSLEPVGLKTSLPSFDLMKELMTRMTYKWPVFLFSRFILMNRENQGIKDSNLDIS